MISRFGDTTSSARDVKFIWIIKVSNTFYSARFESKTMKMDGINQGL
jgi:hypothetical protein